MPVYIDDAKIPWRGREWCHMLSIPPESEQLCKIARKMGLKDIWLQDEVGHWPHFDVVIEYRDLAIHFGAIPITQKELAHLRHQYRAQKAEEKRLADGRY